MVWGGIVGEERFYDSVQEFFRILFSAYGLKKTHVLRLECVSMKHSHAVALVGVDLFVNHGSRNRLWDMFIKNRFHSLREHGEYDRSWDAGIQKP